MRNVYNCEGKCKRRLEGKRKCKKRLTWERGTTEHFIVEATLKETLDGRWKFKMLLDEDAVPMYPPCPSSVSFSRDLRRGWRTTVEPYVSCIMHNIMYPHGF